MNKHDIIKTSCLIFGLYFLILTIGNLRDLITYFSASTLYDDGLNGLSEGIFISSVQLIINLIIGVLLLVNSNKITSRLTDEQSDKLSLNIKKIDIIEVALIIVAVIAVVPTIPEILHKIVHYVYFNEYENFEKHRFWTGQQKAAIFYSIFMLAVGLILLFNARFFAKKLNGIGVKDDEHEKGIEAL